ncbi:MAG: hypothetical protein K2H75_05035 [Muribaculaceae bacterium]|nr:hypothetical protein [Muribaculaceae bacterium]
MDNGKKKLYIVSFGDSEKYRLVLKEDDSETLENVEKKLDSYLRDKFPGDSFAYFTSPKVTEVAWEHRDRYETYPELDDKAIEAIKAVLAKEVKDRDDMQQLNSDAPYDNTGDGVGTL